MKRGIKKQWQSWVLLLSVVLCLFRPVGGGFVWADSQEELLVVAQKAFSDGLYDVAISYLEQLLQQYPDTQRQVEARLLLGQSYFFKSQYVKAYDVFQLLLSYPEFKDATLFWLGETYFKAGDYSKAKEDYRQVIDIYPDSEYVPQAYYSLGWSDFELGDYQKAKKAFQELVKRFPIHPLSDDAAFKIGECEYNMHSYEIAVQYFQSYLLKYSTGTHQAEAYFYIGEAFYYLNDYLTAGTYYAKASAIAYDPKLSFMAKVSMGWCYLKLGKYDLSQRYFGEAEQISKDKGITSDEIYLGIATLNSEMGNYKDALEAYGILVEKFANSPRIIDAYLGKANIHYALKEYPDAIKYYQLIIDKYGNDAQQQDIMEKAYYGLAWTYLKSGNPDQSIQSFERIMSRTESKVVKVSALTQIGDAYQDMNELQKAIDIYDRILREYPDSIYADYVQFRQGIALLKLNKIEAATLSFQTLQANFPASKHLREVKYYLGLSYFKKKDWQQAIAYSKDYLGQDPKPTTFFAEAKYVLALAYFNAKDYERALPVFQELLKEGPEQKAMLPVAKFSEAECFYYLGKVDDAIEKWQNLIAEYPGSESAQDALIKLGEHYLEAKDGDRAIAFYQQFLDSFPGGGKIGFVHYQLGQTYQLQGKWDEALNHYKLIDDKIDRSLYTKAELAVADIFAQKMDPQAAIATYEKITQSAPDFKRDAYVKLAEIYKDLKDYQKVIQSYQNAVNTDQGMSKIKSAEIQFYLADVYELLNQSDKAVEVYLKIPYVYTKETDWIIKAYLRTARIFEEQEKWPEAKTIYGKILTYKMEESKYAQERISWIDDNHPVGE